MKKPIGKIVVDFTFTNAQRNRLTMALGRSQIDVNTLISLSEECVTNWLDPDDPLKYNEYIEKIKDIGQLVKKLHIKLNSLNEKQVMQLEINLQEVAHKSYGQHFQEGAFFNELETKLELLGEMTKRVGRSKPIKGRPLSREAGLVSRLVQGYQFRFGRLPPQSKDGHFAIFVEVLFGILDLGGSGRELVRLEVKELITRQSKPSTSG